MKQLHRIRILKMTGASPAATGIHLPLTSYLLLFTIAFLFLPQITAAQPYTVNVTIIVPPPYSPYLQDYLQYENKMVIQLQNLTSQTQSVKLIGSVEGDNGIALITNENYQPATPITIAPNAIFRVPASTRSRSFLDPNNLDFVGPENLKTQILKDGILPEGTYTICLQAVDYRTDQPLSDEAPAGCAILPIAFPTPVQLMLPACENDLDSQLPLFQWTLPGGNIANAALQYDLFIIEWLQGSNPQDLVQLAVDYNAGNAIIRRNLSTPAYQYMVTDPKLKEGATYLWVVRVRDRLGKVLFENNGLSETCLFNIPENQIGPVVSVDNIGPVGMDPGSFQLLPISTISGQLNYKFYGDINTNAFQATLAPTLNMMNLEPGQHIQNQGYNAGGLQSGLVPESGGIYNSTSIAAFDNGTYQVPPPPQYILPANYTAGGRPLPHARIRFTARFAIGKTPIIRYPSDLQYIGTFGNPIRVTGPGITETISIDIGTKVIASTMTNGNGDYSVTFLADETFGMLHSGALHVEWGAGEFPAGADGYGLYRVITMEVEEKWFCHPDIVIFLQPGQSFDAPVQTVLVQSYNVEFTVRANDKDLQFASPNGPISNAVVKIGRSQHIAEQMPECFPDNEIRIEDFEPMLFGSPTQNIMVGDTGMTDTHGKITFHRLVRHEGIGGCGNELGGNQWPQDGYYLEAGTHPTIGQYHYHTERKRNFAPCTARLPAPCPANECAPRSADYVPPTISEEIRLMPLLPKIMVNSRVLYDNTQFALPNTTLLMSVYHPDGKYKLAVYKTDTSGLFSKQFLYPSDFYENLIATTSAGNLTTGYVMDYFKSGFKRQSCLTCGTAASKKYLQYGEKWLIEPTLLPGSHVKGNVEDEHGQAIYGDIKIGDGPYLPFEPKWLMIEGLNANALELPFDIQGISLGQQNQPANQAANQPAQLIPGSASPNNSVIIEMGGMEIVHSPGIGLNSNFVQKSTFSYAAQNGQQIPLIIRPEATNYFADTFYVTIPAGHEPPGFDLGTFVIKEKLRRPRIVVRKLSQILNQNQEIVNVYTTIANAEVLLSNFPVRMTDGAGAVEYEFGGLDNEYRLRINATGFVPYDDFVVIPATKNAYEILITLDQGETVTGKVTRIAGQAIADARIYAEVGSNDYGGILVETFTDASGNYTLEGLPKGQVQIKASASDPNVTYIGQTKTINTLNTTICNFQLVEAPFNMTTIWNLPVDLESVTPSGNNWIISGAFVELPENARFKPELSTQRLPFTGITVKTVGSQAPNGKYKAEPVAAYIKSTTAKFRSVLNDAHVVDMSGPPSSGMQGQYQYHPNYQPVTIAKIRIEKNENNNGLVRARTFSLLEYFRISYNYDGHFYLGETSNSAVISAYKGSQDNSMPETYFLMDHNFTTNQASNADFSVHHFDAYCDRTQSYVRDDSFVLSIKLIVDLPQSNPDKLTVSTGNVIVLTDNIIVNSGDEPLEFDLETWHVKTGNWQFDPQQGGLVTSGIITTNLLEFYAPHILIKPNSLKLPPADQINLDEITLGGILDLDMEPGAKLHFDYVNNPMHDPGTGHWRLVLSNQQVNNAVASISGLPGWPNQTTVDIHYIENFSDGFEKLTLAPNQVVNHYNMISQTVSNIFFAEGGITLTGNTNLGIPNLPDGYSANFTYYEEQSELKVRVQGLYTKFETTGQVEFQGDQQHDRILLNWNHFEVTGGLTIYDDLSPNVIRLRAKLIKKPNDIRVKVIDIDAGGELEGNIKQIIVMGGGQNGNQKVIQGEQLVVQSGWDLLRYQAQFAGYGGSFQDDEDLMWFKVNGSLTNDESKGDEIKLSNIETPFGDFVLTLDFNEMALVGDLRVSNIPMGAVHIIEGAINMRMGGLGFYIVGHLRALYPMIGELNTNIITGYYPHIHPEASAILKQGMYINKLPNFLTQSGIQGLYICANKPLLTVDWEVDIVVFKIGVYANAGVDARFWLNFGDSYGGAHLGGLAYADFEVYARVLVCDMCVGLLAELGFEAEYQWVPNTEFDISVCGTVGFNVNFCDLAGFNDTAKVVLGWNSGSNDVYFDLLLGESCSDNLPTTLPLCKHF